MKSKFKLNQNVTVSVPSAPSFNGRVCAVMPWRSPISRSEGTDYIIEMANGDSVKVSEERLTAKL